jgi:Zn-dependent protease
MTTILVVLIGWIFSLCLHEFSHALIAYLGGDTSVKDKGYLTFNPLKYTHPVYSLLLPMLFLIMGGIGLPGGAVYIERWRLRSKAWESAVSLAGPAANLMFAVLLAILFRLAPVASSVIGPGLAFLALLQLMAVVLNLVPIPPLDGFGIISPSFAPPIRQQVERWGNVLIIVFFLALWYVPFISGTLWSIAFTLLQLLGISPNLAALGYDKFHFWLK